ncbi:IS4 family transposase [Endozoicomonas montiporae]|nr:IS4 family transposase [Endozoicomonas montiporae]
MNPSQISTIKNTLQKCFSEDELTLMAEELGFTVRHRLIKPLELIIAFIACLGGDGCSTTQADLYRKFIEMTGLNISDHSWREQVKKTSLPLLILWLWLRCLDALSRKVISFEPSSPFSEFQPIRLHDGSSQAVYDELKDVLPGRFNKVSPAAIEMHATVDLLEDSFVRVQMMEDTRSERACLRALHSSLKRTLILIDAGYFELEYFGAVDDREGCFLCRAPQSINPVIHRCEREDGKQYHRYEGKKLNEVLSSFPKDKCMDLDVEWPQLSKRTFRLVVRWNGQRECWVFIVTNLSRDNFSLEQVFLGYCLRWQIELIFKEVKSYAGWHRFNTKFATLVISLVLLSFIVATLKRYLAHATEADMDAEISTHKVAKCGTHLFGNVMKSLMKKSRCLSRDLKNLISFWEKSAKREHPARDRQTGRSVLGLVSGGAA